MYAADLGGIENPDSLWIKNTVGLKFRVHGVPIWMPILLIRNPASGFQDV